MPPAELPIARPPKVAPAFALEPSAGAITIARSAGQIWLRHLPRLVLVVALVHGPIGVAHRLVDDAHLVSELVSYVLGAVLGVIGDALVVPAILYSVVEALRSGAKAPLGATFGFALARWGEVLLVALATSAAVFLRLLQLVVPGVLAAVDLSIATEIVVLERPRFHGPLERSRRVVAGRRWRVVGTFALVSAPGLVASLVLPDLAEAAGGPWVGLGADLVVSVVGLLATLAALVIYATESDQPEGASWLDRLRWGAR